MITTTGSESSRNPFRFSTKYADDETELVYYGRLPVALQIMNPVEYVLKVRE